jgi:hypothetical protein
MKKGGWEMRRALRYGSELVGFSSTLEKAKKAARDDIKKNGDVGRIETIDRDKRVVYYDVHEEMS